MACFRGVGNFQPPPASERRRRFAITYASYAVGHDDSVAPQTKLRARLHPQEKRGNRRAGISFCRGRNKCLMTDRFRGGGRPCIQMAYLRISAFSRPPPMPALQPVFMVMKELVSLSPLTCAPKLQTRIPDFRVNDGWRTCQLYARNKWFPKPHPIAYSPLSSITQSFNKHNFTYCKYKVGRTCRQDCLQFSLFLFYPRFNRGNLFKPEFIAWDSKRPKEINFEANLKKVSIFRLP